ncbi:MAG: ankyrin repeat domain-containing protein [Kiloniellales bacterium]
MADRSGPDQAGSGQADPDLLALVAAGDHEGLAAALGGGAAPDASDGWGVSALCHAAARGDLEAARLLLDRGAQVDKTSDVGNSALMAAAAAGHIEVVRLLLERGADPARVNKWGFGPQDWGSWPANSAEVLDLLRSR